MQLPKLKDQYEAQKQLTSKQKKHQNYSTCGDWNLVQSQLQLINKKCFPRQKYQSLHMHPTDLV